MDGACAWGAGDPDDGDPLQTCVEVEGANFGALWRNGSALLSDEPAGARRIPICQFPIPGALGLGIDERSTRPSLTGEAESLPPEVIVTSVEQTCPVTTTGTQPVHALAVCRGFSSFGSRTYNNSGIGNVNNHRSRTDDNAWLPCLRTLQAVYSRPGDFLRPGGGVQLQRLHLRPLPRLKDQA